jgi:hypothetical protein
VVWEGGVSLGSALVMDFIPRFAVPGVPCRITQRGNDRRNRCLQGSPRVAARASRLPLRYPDPAYTSRGYQQTRDYVFLASNLSELVNESGLTICNAEFRFGSRTIGRAESEFGVTRAGIRITSQALSC